MLLGVKVNEADTCAATVLLQDSTIEAQRKVHENDSTIIADVQRQFRELDRRTMPKGAAPWLIAAGFVIGFLLGR